MSAQRADDVMADLSSRFALGRPRGGLTDPSPEGGGTAGRPFGLRFFTPAAETEGPPLPPYRYCPARQLSVVNDGTDEPLLTRIMDWDHTTTGQLDGAKGPSEEWRLDYRAGC